MLFSSSVFLLFFLPLLTALYYLIPARYLKARNLLLLAFSLCFYAFGGIRYFWLLILSIGVNYLGGLVLGRVEQPGLRKLLLVLFLAVNLGLLGWFKYAGFFASTLVDLGIPVTVPQVVLPIGISFYTFQAMSYVLDVYSGRAQVQRNPLNVALYIAFFPQLVAGPIVRYTTIEEAIGRREHSLELFTTGLVRFMLGFGKKMLLANTMAEVTDTVFALTGSGTLAASLAWVGAVAYTFQIYFDFSGYSDMAIGLGKMFGFHFEENFDYPYISGSVTEYRRRWHISLSRWFRDYVYFPLGGNRCSAARHIFNLTVVWLLTGLWHGANWTFVVWGLYYNFWLILEKYPLKNVLPKINRHVRSALTMLIVCCGFVLFRSDSIGNALSYLADMLGRHGFASGQAKYFLLEYRPEWLLCVLACLPIRVWLQKFLEPRQDRRLWWAVSRIGPMVFGLLVFFLGYLKLVFGSYNPFIYFQF